VASQMPSQSPFVSLHQSQLQGRNNRFATRNNAALASGRAACETWAKQTSGENGCRLCKGA